MKRLGITDALREAVKHTGPVVLHNDEWKGRHHYTARCPCRPVLVVGIREP